MSLYSIGILLAMGIDIAMLEDSEPDTWKNAFKHLVIWLLSWVVVGFCLGKLLVNKDKCVTD